MRTLTATALAKIADRFGNEPVCIVKVAWNGVNFQSYADKAYSGVQGRILSIGNIDDVRNLSGTGGNAQVSVVLDDTDQHIRNLINHFDVHKVPVQVWQGFVGMPLADAFLLFSGRVVTPISWSEGEQQVSFEATTYIETQEVGFAPDEAQFPTVSPKLISRTWPLAFGDCVHIPAVQSWERISGTNATGIGIPDYTLPYKYWHMIERLTILAFGFTYYLQAVNVCRQLISTAPVDFVSLLNLPANVAADLRYEADAWEKKQTVVTSDLRGQVNYLDRITIPQLYLNMPKKEYDDLFQAIGVINQIEVSFAEVILTEQQFKQDHEDLANLTHALDKAIDKLQALMETAPSQTRYVAALNGLIKYLGKQIADRIKTTRSLVQQEVRIPTSQSTLFTLAEPQDPKVSDAVVKALTDLKERGIDKLTALRDELASITDRVKWKQKTEVVKQAITDLLSEQKLIVKAYGDSLEKIIGVKERLKIDMENSEYGYKTINEINKKIDKLTLDYHKSLKELWKIQRAIIEQQEMPKQAVVISSNSRFPQGPIALQIKDMVFAGILSGNVFQVGNVVPKYSNIVLAPRQTNEIDCFWITDPNIILKGCYCLKTFIIGRDDPDYDARYPSDVIRNRIFKVKEQYGTKCVIELVENKERQAPKEHKRESAPLQKLPDYVMALFEGAHHRTRNEIVRLLENSLEKYERERLQQMKSKLEKLSELVESAPDADRRAAANEAIFKSVNEYNERINRLRFKKEAVDKCNEKLSNQESADLLKMENLKLNMAYEGIDNTPTTIAPATRLYYITGYDMTGIISGASLVMLPSWFQFSPEGQELSDNQTVLPIPGTNQVIKANYLPDSSFWYAPPGSDVSIANDTSEKYIANILPSQVKAVYGKSAVNGTLQLVPIPKSLYTVNENDVSYQNPAIPDPEFVPMAVTSITMRQPLTAYNLGFGKEVYVSLRSSVGPNTCDIIQWIIETWTNLTVDSASFASVHARLVNYPQNFAIFSKQDALKLIEQIAWENRCAVYVRNEVVYIQYLAEDQTPVATITETDVEEGSLSYELTSTEDLATKVVAKWKPDYAMPSEDTIVVRYKVRKYGLFTKSFNFETFNIFELVYKSLTFWSIRYANSFKRVKFKTFMHKMRIETFDWITLDFVAPYFSSGPIIALVEKADYDSASQTMSFQCWVPIRSGELTKYGFAIPADLSATVLYPPAEDIVLGLAGNYQNSATPTNIPFRINANVGLVEAIELRPKDYGDPFPGDSANLLPPSPLQGLSLTDFMFNPANASNYNTPPYPKAKTENSGRPGIGFDSGSGEKEKEGQGRSKEGSPMRENFTARINQVISTENDEYTVRSTDNYQYTATLLQPALGRLRLGDPVAVIRDHALGRYVINNSRPAETELEYYVVREEKADYVLCAKFNYNTSAENVPEIDDGKELLVSSVTPANPLQPYDKDLCKDGGSVAVAKPRILQAAPFDGKAVEYPDVKVVYKYVATEFGKRKAQIYDQTMPEDTEKITPPYYPGDIITVRRGPTGLLDASGAEILLVDVNEGGRAWAKVVDDAN